MVATDVYERIPQLTEPTTARWSDPQKFQLTREEDIAALAHLFANGEGPTVTDPVDLIADDLFEMEHPGLKDDDDAREEFKDAITSQGPAYGNWFYFPWANQLVRYADKETHRNLRTMRNRNLITAEEQARLYESTIAIFGLSVGSSTAEQLALAGIGGTIITADMDIVTPSNTNRLPSDPSDLGGSKIDRLAKRVSAIDPYVEQVHLNAGANEASIARIIGEYRPTIMVDAVDSFPVKALIRAYGEKHKTPVLMATDVGDSSILDIEMYGHDEDVTPFNGRLTSDQHQALLDGRATEDEIKQMMFTLVGTENVSERMMSSVTAAFNGEIAGLPQLGSTATLGGVVVSRVVREIIVGKKLKSGRKIINLDELLLA